MTAFDLQGFRSQLKGDGARPNLFEVQMAMPGTGIATIGTSAADISRNIAFLCRAASLPGSTMGIATVPFFGREFKLPGNPSYPEWTVTIINDENFTIRNSFEKWMNALNGHLSNLRDPAGYNSSEYSVDAHVIQYAKGGASSPTAITANAGVLKKYKFIGMWPTTVSPIELGWDTNNQVEEYSVTFAYQWWESTTDGVTS